ncbi:YicC/YloC family endoribonuclease [Terrihabitans sp. B22-R8]|uniref:YicC/YloC family endoribonuclease n=1 Tax=Terrihabitans sp. B22-R8 TaxID=3425128 RepID=UPI00403D32E9
MNLASMTGFARADGASTGMRWTWELKTVNARGLDIRLRLPPGLDHIEQEARAIIGTRLTRGTCHISLTICREGVAPVIRINQDVLASVVQVLDVLRLHIDATPPSLDGLLAVKGLVEVAEPETKPDARAAEQETLLAGLRLAVEQLVASRLGEGQALTVILGERLDSIEKLTRHADVAPSRQPAAIRERLAEQVRALLDTHAALDPDRLHQEAVLLASKADIREEIDRLYAHVQTARGLIAEGKAVGRRLDFLAQELGRESNTLCAKSNDVALTAIGLELKTTVEQFREQVQNVE